MNKEKKYFNIDLDLLDANRPLNIIHGGRGNNLRVRMPKIYWATEAELRRAFKSEQNFKKFIDKFQAGGYTQIMLKRKKNET